MKYLATPATVPTVLKHDHPESRGSALYHNQGTVNTDENIPRIGEGDFVALIYS